MQTFSTGKDITQHTSSFDRTPILSQNLEKKCFVKNTFFLKKDVYIEFVQFLSRSTWFDCRCAAFGIIHFYAWLGKRLWNNSNNVFHVKVASWLAIYGRSIVKTCLNCYFDNSNWNFDFLSIEFCFAKSLVSSGIFFRKWLVRTTKNKNLEFLWSYVSMIFV